MTCGASCSARGTIVKPNIMKASLFKLKSELSTKWFLEILVDFLLTFEDLDHSIQLWKFKGEYESHWQNPYPSNMCFKPKKNRSNNIQYGYCWTISCGNVVFRSPTSCCSSSMKNSHPPSDFLGSLYGDRLLQLKRDRFHCHRRFVFWGHPHLYISGLAQN